MSARRIARELAVITLPQLPKDKAKLEKMDFDVLMAKSIHMLVDHARHCLEEANSYAIRAHGELTDIELDHPDNAHKTTDVRSVTLNTGQIKDQLANLETAIRLISEALDIPEMTMAADHSSLSVECRQCGKKSSHLLRRSSSGEIRDFLFALVSSFIDHRSEVDSLISEIKTKWRMERMVSVDRDILRLACVELFFMPDVPVNVCVSEAVELSRRFADEQAVKFINGVLSDLAQKAVEFRETGVLPKVASDDKGEIGAAEATAGA